jgi:hypothetical protein
MRYSLALFLLFVSAFSVWGQNDFPIPTPPPLPSPTFYPSATPVPTDTYPLEAMDNSLATIEAELQKPVEFSPPAQITFLANGLAFVWWIANNGEALFGPFNLIFTFVLFFTPIALVVFTAYVGNLIISTMYSLFSDIYQKIRG